MAFSERATFKYSTLKLFLSFNPSNFMISVEDMYVSPIHLIRVSTCWLNLRGTCGVFEDSLWGTYSWLLFPIISRPDMQISVLESPTIF